MITISVFRKYETNESLGGRGQICDMCTIQIVFLENFTVVKILCIVQSREVGAKTLVMLDQQGGECESGLNFLNDCDVHDF